MVKSRHLEQLKKKSQYLHNGLTDFDANWYGDAVWTPSVNKFWISKIQDAACSHLENGKHDTRPYLCYSGDTYQN